LVSSDMNALVVMLAAAAVASSRQAASSTVASSSSSSSSSSLPSAVSIASTSTSRDLTLPDRAEFEARVQAYHDGLNKKKQTKAMITRAYYARILAVMHNPSNTRNESSQFRFWTRAMFRLDAQGKLRNDGKVVAVREDFYDIIAEAHVQLKHGGRDKTHKQVQKRWSWIQKDLVMQFIKLCPICTEKNPNGNAAPRRSKTSIDNFEPLAPMSTRRSNSTKRYVDMDDSSDSEDERGPWRGGAADDDDYEPDGARNLDDNEAGIADKIAARGSRSSAFMRIAPPLNPEMAAAVENASPDELQCLPSPPTTVQPSNLSTIFHSSPALSTGDESSSYESTAPPTPCTPALPLLFLGSHALPHAYATTGSYHEIGEHHIISNDHSTTPYDPLRDLFAPLPKGEEEQEEEAPSLLLSDLIDFPEDAEDAEDADADEEAEVKPISRRDSPTTLQAASALASLTHGTAQSPDPASTSSSSGSSSPLPFAVSSGTSSKSLRTRTSSARDEDGEVAFPPSKRAKVPLV
ncbi:hypothetical protein JCM6882_000378, partial [Rhodosporidiobolus microsporus]